MSCFIPTGMALGFQRACKHLIIVNLMRQVKRYKQAQREFIHMQVMIFLNSAVRMRKERRKEKT